MEQNKKFLKIPENYVHYPLRYYQNITQFFQNPGVEVRPDNRFPRQQNDLRCVPRNIPDNDNLTNKFLNSVHQFETVKNNLHLSYQHQQVNPQRLENVQHCQQNRPNFRPSSNQRFQNPQTSNFEPIRSNFIPRNVNMDQNFRFRMPNPALIRQQMQKRFDLPHCPPDLIPPLLPPPMPPMLPPPLPPLPQFQGQVQRFVHNGNYRGEGRVPLQNRPMRPNIIPKMASPFLDNEIKCQDPYSMPKQSRSEGCSENSLRIQPTRNKNQLQEETNIVQTEFSVHCTISVNSSSIGYSGSNDHNFIQSQNSYECPPQRFTDSPFSTDCVERSPKERLTDAVKGVKSHDKYERQMKISMLGNSMNLRGKNNIGEIRTKSQESSLNLSDSKTEKWSFDSPMKLSVKKVPSLPSKNNVSMDTGKENMPRVVLKRLCKSTVKKHSKFLVLTSPNRASTPSDIKVLNLDKRSVSESNIFAQRNKLRKFELAKLESKHLNPLWLSPILSENEQSKKKRSPGNGLLTELSLKSSGRSRPMIKSRKCNRNLFDSTQNQVQSSKALEKSKMSPQKESKYISNSHRDISAADLDCSRLDSSFKNQQTSNFKDGISEMYDPCVITMPTNSRESAGSNFPRTSNDDTVIYSLKSSDIDSKVSKDETKQPSSFEDFQDNIGTSDHEGGSNAGNSSEADVQSDDGSDCSSNLSQYSTVYDDFKRIQDKAIKEAKSSKKLQKCKQISIFSPSKKKWHLRSNTYPLFSPVKKTLAEKAKFKNRARYSRDGSLPENISLAPCKIMIEDLKQMKDRFHLMQQKSKKSGKSDRNLKEKNLKLESKTVPIVTNSNAKPASNRKSFADSSYPGPAALKTNRIQRSKKSASLAAASSEATPSARNRHSSISSTSTISSLVSRNSKSTRSMGTYYDTATSKLVKVFPQPSKPYRPKKLSRPSCLQSLPAQQYKSHLSSKDLSPRPKTRPRSMKSPLINKKLGVNVSKNNTSSVHKLRPGGLGIEWAEVQAGSPLGIVRKKASKSGSLKKPSEVFSDYKRSSSTTRLSKESSGTKLDSERTPLTDSSNTYNPFGRSENEEMPGVSVTTIEKDPLDRQQLPKSGKGTGSTALDPVSEQSKQLDKTSLSTVKHLETSYHMLERDQEESSSHSSCAPDYFQPSDGCPVETDIASDIGSWVSSDSKRIEDTGSEAASSQNQECENLKSHKENRQLLTESQNNDKVLEIGLENSQKRNYLQKINSPKHRRPVIPFSELSAKRSKSLIKTRVSGIIREKTFSGYRHEGDSPISKRSKLSNPYHQGLASPKEQSVPTGSADSAVKNSNQLKRRRPCNPKYFIKQDAQSHGHRAASLMIEDGRTEKYTLKYPKSLAINAARSSIHSQFLKNYSVNFNSEEIPKKRRCVEGDISSVVPKRITKHGLMPDPASKRSSNNDPLSVKDYHVQRKEQNKYDHEKLQVSRMHHISRPQIDNSLELLHTASVKQSLKGPASKRMANAELMKAAELKKTTQICRMATARRNSESSISEVNAGTNEEQSSEALGVLPTIDSSPDSPKHKKRKEEKSHIREAKSITKVSGKKIGSQKSLERYNADNLVNTDTSSKTNSDQLTPKRKHRRVEKQTGTDHRNACPSQERAQSTRSHKKRTSSKDDHGPKQRTNKEGIPKQSSTYNDKEGTSKKCGPKTAAVQKQAPNQKSRHRKPTFIITQGNRKSFWCRFCYGFRGSIADMRIHVGEKHPYRCHICKAVFETGTEAESHRKAHINKLYHCKICQRDLHFRRGIIQRHERSSNHKQLVRVQKQILEIILNKHGSPSLELPDLSQFADLIRFPSTVSSSENTETSTFVGQNSAITRFYLENEEIQNLLSKVEQSLKESGTKKATEVVLPQTSSSVLGQDQPIKIASVQPMVPTTDTQPVIIEASGNQPIEYQPDSCGLNFPEETLKHGQFTSQSDVVIESRSVLNTSGYQLPESNSTLTVPGYDSTQSNRFDNQSQTYSTTYPSDCFDFDMNFNDLAASRSDKSSENVLYDFLTSSKKMASSDVPDDFLEFWSSNYYQNVDYFYDNLPTFGLSSNPAPVPVSVSQIIGSSNQNFTSNLHHQIKLIPEKAMPESISISDISHSSVRGDKRMSFAEKTFPYSQNCATSLEFGGCSNFTQHYQTPIMSATFKNGKSISHPSATITSAENTENGCYQDVELSGNVMSDSQKGGLAISGVAVGYKNSQSNPECSGKTLAYPSSSGAAHNLKDKHTLAQNCRVMQMDSLPINQSTAQISDKFSTKQRTEILDELLQPLISESWCNLRFPSKQLEAEPSTLGKQMEETLQNSPIETHLGSGVPMPNTEPKCSQNNDSSSTKAQDTVDHKVPVNRSEGCVHNLHETPLTQANGSEVERDSNSDPRASTPKIDEVDHNEDNLNCLNNVASQAAERLEKTNEESILDTDSNTLDVLNNIQPDQNKSCKPNLGSKETTETAKVPTAKDPITIDPTAKDPTVIDPIAKDPTAIDSTSKDPTAIDPTVMDPTATDLVLEELTQAEKNTGEVTLYTGEVTSDAGAVTLNTGEVTPNTGEVTSDTREVTPDTRDVTSDAGAVTLDAREVTPDAGEVTSDTREVTLDTREFTSDAGEVTSDTEETDDGLEDHNDTLINNISALDDPDFSLTSLLNAVLPEESLSSTNLPMKSLLDISETDLKMAEAESALDEPSSGAIANDKVKRSTNLNTGTISGTSSQERDIASFSSKRTTASDFIANLKEKIMMPVNSMDQSTPEVKGINRGDVEDLDKTHIDNGLNISNKESSNTELIDETQETASKYMTVKDLKKDKNLVNELPCEREAFFLSLKLCQSAQDISNMDAKSMNSDTDTTSIELNDNIHDDDDDCLYLDIPKLQDRTEDPKHNADSVQKSTHEREDLSESVSGTPKSKHSLSTSISEQFPCLATALLTPPSKKDKKY